MVVSSYCGKKNDKLYRNEFIKKAKDVIIKYPSLARVFFDIDVPIKHYNHNIFFNIANLAYTENKTLSNKNARNSSKYKYILDEIENLLTKEINLFERSSRIQKKIISKMRSFTRNNNFSKYIEFQLYIQLLKNKHVSKIIYGDISDFNHDFRIFIQNIEFNLEVTSLYENKVDKILEESFDEICRKAIQKIPLNYSVSLEIDLEKIIYKNKFDKEYITKLVLEEIDKLLLLILENSWELFEEDFMGSKNLSLYQYLNSMERIFGENYFSSDKVSLLNTLYKLKKSEKGKKFLKEISVTKLLESPIKSCFVFEIKSKKCIQISNRIIFPSTVETKRIEEN